jgi:hypothetical protein
VAREDIDFDRLIEAKRASRKVLERFRADRRDAIKRYAGAHWLGETRKDFINLLSEYITITSRRLVAKEPRVLLSTFDMNFKPVVGAMETWMNEEIERQNMADTFQRAVIDALFSMAVVKVCIQTPTDAAMSGWQIQAGSAGLMLVDLDDWVHDTFANTQREWDFMGHRYRVPLRLAKKDPRFRKDARMKLTATDDFKNNEDGDERIGELGRGEEGMREEFEDYVDLWELYLPKYGKIVTFADDRLDEKNEPLAVQDWIGPPGGPYHLLYFDVVPGNSMPRGPAQCLYDLHDLINRLYSKLANQAQDQKNLTLHQMQGGDADALAIKNAGDGEMVGVQNPQLVQQVSMGGPDQRNLAMAMQFHQLFDQLGGNLRLLGGQGAQSATASQDEMLNQNAGVNVGDKQLTTIRFLSRCLNAMGWFWYHDPYSVMRTTYSLPGMPEYSVQRKVGPEKRPWSRWEDVGLKVDPYSVRHQSPEQRLTGIMTILKTMYLPLAQIAAAQGINLDMRRLLELGAKFLDQPELPELLSIGEKQEAGGQSHQGGGMQGETTRNYVRRNETEQTQDGAERQMMAGMMGVDMGGSQKNGQPQGAY